MSSSVTPNVPYSYYNVLNPTAPLTVPSANSGNSSTTPAAPASGSTSTGTTGTTGALQLPSNILALLQAFLGNGSSDSSNPLSALFGGSSNDNSNPIGELLGNTTGNNDPLAAEIQSGVTSQVYSSVLQAAYNTNNATQPSPSDAVANLISNVSAASNAYNNTILQQAKAVAAANDFEADGKTPLPIIT